MLTALKLVLVAMATTSFAQPITSEQQIDSIIAEMTLEEKVGQMTQLNIDTILDMTTLEIDEGKLEAFAKRGVGSYLNSPFSGGVKNGRMGWTASEWRVIQAKIQEVSINASRFDIPIVYGIDNVHGGTYVENSTLFGQQINAAASFNTDLVKEMGAITGKDTAASGISWTFGPILDIAATPLWARFWETFGEDPFLVSEMAVAIVTGIQESGEVAACLKHFIGYGAPQSGHDVANSYIPDRQLLNYHSVPFKKTIAAGAKTVMESYNTINGEAVASSDKYLNKLLRDDMGFEGMLVTDWAEIRNIQGRHKMANSEEQATEVGIGHTSIDLSMVPYDDKFIDVLVKLVQDGKVSEERVNESVKRILSLKLNLGLFETPVPGADSVDTVGQQADKDIALQLARESIVLARNDDNALPLPEGSTVLVTGPSADNIGFMCGGWTTAWQGYQDSSPHYGFTSILGAMQDKGEVQHAIGVNIDGTKADDYDTAIAAATASDYTIVVVGEHSATEKPNDIDDLSLAAGQREYIQALTATGTKVVVVLIEGRPRLLHGSADDAAAVIVGMLPCRAGGQAIAEIIHGEVNPSGRLPFSYPKNSGNIPYPYYHMASDLCVSNMWHNHECEQEWKFGSGLSYTEFEYSNLTVGEETSNGEITVSVTVQNIGDRAGKETILLFVSQQYRLVAEPEAKMLKAFQKLEFAPQETKDVVFTLDASAYSYYEPQIGQGYLAVADKGKYFVAIGPDTKCEMYDTAAIEANPDQLNAEQMAEHEEKLKEQALCGSFVVA